VAGDHACRGQQDCQEARTAPGPPLASTCPLTGAIVGPRSGVALDGAGNLFVADCYNNTIPEGHVQWRGDHACRVSGSIWKARTARGPPPDSTAPVAWRWTGRATSSSLSTTDNTIRKITPSGVVTTLAGQQGQ